MNIVQLNNIFKKAAEAQPTVHSFTTQDVYEYWNTGEVKYGSVAFVVTSTSISGGVNQYSAVLYYADRLNEDKSNRDNIKSDAVNTIQAIIGTLNRNIDDLDITYPSRIELFEQKFVDELAGGYVNISITAEGVSECGYDADVDWGNCSNINNQDKTVDIISNGQTTITADIGYTGLGIVTVNTNVPVPSFKTQEKIIEINENGIEFVTYDSGFDGLSNVTINTNVQPNLQSKSESVTENKTITIEPDSTYDGLSSVTVDINVPTPEFKTQEKTQQAVANGPVVITPDSGFDGLSKVTVNVEIPSDINNQDKTIDITSNGTQSIAADDEYSGLGTVTINTNVQPDLQSKSESVTENKTITIEPDSAYDGLSSVTVDINVPAPEFKIQDKTIDIISNGQEAVTADEGFDGLGTVTINTNVQPDLQSKSESVTENKTVEIIPDNGFDGLSKVTVNVNVPATNTPGLLYINDNVGYDGSQLKYLIKEFKADGGYDDTVNMGYTFDNCARTESIELPALPKVNDMQNCFNYCQSLSNLILPTSLPEVTNMDYCFNGCYYISNITYLDLPKVTSLNRCFQACRSLTSLTLSGLSNVTNMSYCFNSCWNLTSLNLPNLDNIIDMDTCFGTMALSEEYKFTDLNISSIGSTITSLTNWDISRCLALTKDSLVNILNALPTISASKTCTLGTTNLSKLTAEEIQIGTDKGWIIN